MPRKKVIKETIWERLERVISQQIEYEKEIEIQKENEEKERRKIEFDKKNVILMLDIHRKFAHESVFGNFEILQIDGSIETIESDEFEKIKSSPLIDFTTFARFMKTDEEINSYCEDINVGYFVINRIERSEYYRNSLQWNIYMIDIEILFNNLRENQFIAPDTSRNTFFQIFNPYLSVFSEPIEWRDIKELVYFLDKCREYSFLGNTKYQNVVEKYRMFKTNFSKGDYIKSNSLRTTLADIKNEFGNYSENQKFLQRTKLLDEFLEYVTL